MSRNKGKKGEREVIDMLQPIVDQVYEAHGLKPPQLKRNQNQSDGGGYDIVGLPWFAPEVKRHETLCVDKWWAQCLAQADAGQAAVLLWRRNGERSWHVRMMGYVGGPGTGLQVPVDISYEDFRRWFRLKLNEELADE